MGSTGEGDQVRGGTLDSAPLMAEEPSWVALRLERDLRWVLASCMSASMADASPRSRGPAERML